MNYISLEDTERFRHVEAAEEAWGCRGIKVVTQNGWFAVRPSGTEDVHKIYAESFKSKEHLAQIQGEARAMMETLFRSAGVSSTRVQTCPAPSMT